MSARAPLLRGFYALPGELVVDNFAGGGGASVGIEKALGRPVDIAINHDQEAIAMHKANHPETRHYCENIWEVDPREACGSRPVGLAWFSPDCRHFSRAKGKALCDQKIRGLAWVVIRWAETVAPRVIILENVEEFQSWGPLLDDNTPDPERVGETFREWLAALTRLGYSLEFQSLVAADYGAPTSRRRLFLIARKDRGAIIWPGATHGKGLAQPWRAAAEIIDWSLPCPSIFLTRKQARKLGVKRPLAPATLRRIVAGIERYVVGAGKPFLLPTTHQGDRRVYDIDDPLRTITAANRGEFAVCNPFLVKYHGGARGHQRGQGLDEPLRTLDGSNRFAVINPFVVRHGHYSKVTGAGLRPGCGAGLFRGQSLGTPLATVCGTNDKHLVMPVVEPADQLAASFLTKYYGTSCGASLEDPMPTITSGGGRAGGHIAEVRALLISYYSNGGSPRGQHSSLLDPLHTVTSKARFGLVMVHGQAYQIVDIGMRMLQPHELFGAQGFPDDYEICPTYNGKPMTKTAMTKLAGNSVCPDVAEKIVAANTRGEACAA